MIARKVQVVLSCGDTVPLGAAARIDRRRGATLIRLAAVLTGGMVSSALPLRIGVPMDCAAVTAWALEQTHLPRAVRRSIPGFDGAILSSGWLYAQWVFSQREHPRDQDQDQRRIARALAAPCTVMDCTPARSMSDRYRATVTSRLCGVLTAAAVTGGNTRKS